ncbi:MAG TPA: YciI family protein [Kiloniellales bacterium]|nr:YciI family protein [Kiloniellales bacterium]
MALFALFRARGPAWRHGRPLEEQPEWPAHAAFMDELAAEGVVLLAGPLEDTGEALVIVRAEGVARAVERLADDPWTRNGLLQLTRIAGWTLRIGSLPDVPTSGSPG